MDDLNLDGLTDEQLLAVIRGMEKGTKKEAPKKARVQTVSGEVIEADSPEELNRILAAKLNEHQSQVDDEPEPPQAATNAAPRPPKFDYKKFEETFVKDPVAGLEYADTVRFGAPMSQLLPQLGLALGTMSKKLQELEAQQFIDQNPEYEPSVENRKAIEKIMTERGWQTSRQTLEDAFAIASSKGLIQSKGGKKQNQTDTQDTNEPWIPPRSRSASEPQTTDQDLIASLNGLSDQQIFELAEKAGIASNRR